MALLLGIDTGGTYTDAVLFDEGHGVLASAKSLTTKHDLSLGIGAALREVLSHRQPEVGLVSLSTTLATNAIVESQGSPIGLLLLGYPPDALDLAGLGDVMGNDPVVFISGGHTVTGSPQAPLDLEAVRQAAQAYANGVRAFAISGYFGVLNPEHELAARDLVRQVTGLPVTCGHELTSELHAPRRALTVALNARLIPTLQQLILAVQAILAHNGIRTPLMVVKGDGSLMSAEMALERPVETILSGPAASVVGARFLSGEEQVMVIDMGGTTTDIALLEGGAPALSRDGATVGGWQTMVEAVQVHTSGLGGDSEVRLDEAGGLVVGPRRVVPLSLLADQAPHILTELQSQWERSAALPLDACFALRQRSLESLGGGLDPDQLELWEALQAGPLSLHLLFLSPVQAIWRRRALNRLVELGLVVISGFTPSDAAHVLEKQSAWSVEAARFGAQLWARRLDRQDGHTPGAAEAFCRRVLQQVTLQLGRAALAAALAQSVALDLSQPGTWQQHFIDHPLGGEEAGDALVDVALTLQRPLVAVGAPAATYFPEVANRLHTRLCIPEHAAVANAVGAVVGSVVQSARLLVRPLPDYLGYRLHTPTGIRDFSDLEDAVQEAITAARHQVAAQAIRAGAADFQVQVQRQDHIFHPENAPDIFIESEIKALAVGRPRLAQEK